MSEAELNSSSRKMLQSEIISLIDTLPKEALNALKELAESANDVKK